MANIFTSGICQIAKLWNYSHTKTSIYTGHLIQKKNGSNCTVCTPRYYRAGGVRASPSEPRGETSGIVVSGQYLRSPALTAVPPPGSLCGEDGEAEVVPGGGVGLQ